MTLEEMLLFNGSSEQFGKYNELLEKRKKKLKQIARIQNRIYDEEDSISVFVGELLEGEEELLQKHQNLKSTIELKIEKAKKELKEIDQELNSMQRR